MQNEILNKKQFWIRDEEFKPIVTEKIFDKNGRLISFTMIGEQGKCALTGSDIRQWYHNEYLPKNQTS